MAGIGLSDFMRNYTQAASPGFAALQQGIGAIAQAQQQKRAHDQGLQDQLAMEQRQHDWQLQQQRHADAQHASDLDAQMATKGFVRAPNGDQAAARRVVEAPAQVRNNPVTNFLNSFGPSAGVIGAAQLGAALNDPRNQHVLTRAGAGQDLSPSSWEHMRDIAWNGGGDTWVPDPALMATLHPAKTAATKGPFDAEQKYDAQARAALVNEPPPTQLQVLMNAAIQAQQSGKPLPAEMQAELDRQTAAWQATKDGTRQRLFQQYIMRDAKAGFPEATDLATRYGWLGGGSGTPQAPGPFNMEADANAPMPNLPPPDISSGPDSEEAAIQRRLQQLSGASGAATPQAAATGLPQPASPPAYPVDVLTQLALSARPGLPNITGIPAGAGPGAPAPGVQQPAPAGPRLQVPPLAMNPHIIGMDTAGGNAVPELQPIIDFLKRLQPNASASANEGQAPTTLDVPLEPLSPQGAMSPQGIRDSRTLERRVAEDKKRIGKGRERAPHHPGAALSPSGYDIGYWPWK